MTIHPGSCHCGALTLSLRTGKSAEHLGARACGCSFCRMHGASWTSDPTGSLHVAITGPFGRYRFGTGSADFLVCGTCGVVAAVLWQSPERLLSVVRVECLATRDQLRAYERPTNFDDEDVSQRFARRARTWTPATLATSG